MAYSVFDGMPRAVWVCSPCSRLSFWMLCEFHFCQRSVKTNTKRIKTQVLSWNGHLNSYHVCFFYFVPSRCTYILLSFVDSLYSKRGLRVSDPLTIRGASLLLGQHRGVGDHQSSPSSTRWTMVLGGSENSFLPLPKQPRRSVGGKRGCRGVKYPGEMDGERVCNGHSLVMVSSHRYVSCDCVTQSWCVLPMR